MSNPPDDAPPRFCLMHDLNALSGPNGDIALSRGVDTLTFLYTMGMFLGYGGSRPWRQDPHWAFVLLDDGNPKLKFAGYRHPVLDYKANRLSSTHPKDGKSAGFYGQIQSRNGEQPGKEDGLFNPAVGGTLLLDEKNSTSTFCKTPGRGNLLS